MDKHLLLRLWREVGRHIDLSESAPELLKTLADALPVLGLRIDHVERGRPVLESLGAAGEHRLGQRRGTASAFQALSNWCLTGNVRVFRGGQQNARPLDVVPVDDLDHPRVYGPLASELGDRGIAVFRLKHEPNETELELLREALPPLAAAMENQLRLTELARLREAAEADRASLLNRLGRDQVRDTIVGVRGGLRDVMQQVRVAAPTDATVLLLGETGTGKEVVARLVHEQSSRAASPFIRVNCGAIPPDLIDTELFGHVKGSFTGAVSDRQGWFERADSGTLFLDEIGDLPAAAQVRMLRVLQEGTFHRVGGHEEVRVDVRVIAATHRDLRQSVREGQFREDLWYRVAVFPIQIPALRDRPDDIPDLAAHFAHRAARKLGLPDADLSEEDVARLSAYPWPGNVRELAAVMERAAILGNGARLEVGAALGAATSSSTLGAEPVDTTVSDEPAGKTLSLDKAIAKHIEQALTRTAGRVDGPLGAARLLEVNPNTLRSRMRKLGIDAKMFKHHPLATRDSPGWPGER